MSQSTGQPIGVTFVVQNVSMSPSRIVTIFNNKIYPVYSLDLMKIPGIGEEDIRDSLLKGDLGAKIRSGQLRVLSSTIVMPESDTEFVAFLTSIGLQPTVLNSTTAKGDPGPQGIPGPQGDPGPQGEPGTSGSGGGGNVFVYRAGATPVGNVFDTWAGAYAAAFATNIPSTIIIDDTITSTSIPTDSGNFDLHQITLSGVGNYSEQNFLSVFDNTTFNQGLYRVTNGLMLSFYGNTNPLITLVPGEYTTIIDNGASLVAGSSNNEEIFDLNVEGNVILEIYLGNTSCIGAAGAPIVNFGNASSSTLNIVVADYSFIYGTAISGSSGAVVVSIYSPTSTVPAFPGFTGSLATNIYPNASLVTYNFADITRWNFPGTLGTPVLVSDSLDSLAAGLTLAASHVNGIAVSGTPSAGQVLTADSSSSAVWGPVDTISSVTVSGTPDTGQVLTATSSSTANWQPPGGTLNVVQGYAAAQTSNIGTGDHIIFNNIYFTAGSNIVLDTSSPYRTTATTASIGRITLAPNHTYKLTFNPNQLDGTAGISFYWMETNFGQQVGLITHADPTGSCGDVIGFLQTGSDPGIVELHIQVNDGVTNIGFNFLPWFCVEEIA